MREQKTAKVGGLASAVDKDPPVEAGKRTRVQQLKLGKPLPSHLRAKFEASLGTDLSQVRIHDDDVAHAHARGVQARAFAFGHDIVFAHGEYDPESAEGQSLIAHEVAHTVQQRDAATQVSERDAAATDDVAAHISDGNPDAHEVHAEFNLGRFKTTQPGDAAELGADVAARAMAHGKVTTLGAHPLAIARKTEAEPVTAPAPGGAAPAPGGAAPAADAAAGETKSDAPPTIEVVGATDVAEDHGVGTDHAVDARSAELQATGEAIPPQGGAEELAGGGATATADAGGDAAPAPAPAADGGGAGGDAPMSPELQASIEAAQNDAKQATVQSQADADAYKTEIKAQQDQFDNQQHAVVLEQLKTMTPADKRGSLKDMGYDDKTIRGMKDSEIDGVITGQIEKGQRRTKIMGMDPDELAALSPDQKIQFLVDLGIDRGDLNEIGPQRSAALFDDVMKVAHVPGNHEVKVKIHGGFFTSKSWVVTIKVDAADENGTPGSTDFEAKKEGGFFSKLWGWIKLLLPIILICLAPFTGGATLIVLAIYQAAIAIKNGDWLGAIIGVAGALAGVGAFMAVRGLVGASTTFVKIAQVAGKVAKVAQAAQDAMMASKSKNAGSLLGALASGAAAFAGFASKGAENFAKTMNNWSDKFKKWAGIIGGAESVARGVETGDPVGAMTGAFDSVSAALGVKTDGGKTLKRIGEMSNFVDIGVNALKGNAPNYGYVASAALGLAGVLTDDKRLEDAARITGAATRLKVAWDNKDTDPGALAAAAFDVATAIQVARFDVANQTDDPEAAAAVETSRTALMEKWSRAGRVVSYAGEVITAAFAKPRPNYAYALEAVTGMIAEFRISNRVTAIATLTGRMSQWTDAINSKDEKLIFQAASEVGYAINDLRDVIKQDRADAAAKLEAEKQKDGTDAGTDTATTTPAPAPGTTPDPTAATDTGADDFPELPVEALTPNVETHTLIQLPDGTIVDEDGKVVPPDAVGTPGGANVETHTYITLPDGSIVDENGTVLRPNANTQPGSGASVETHTYITLPDGSIVDENGQPVPDMVDVKGDADEKSVEEEEKEREEARKKLEEEDHKEREKTGQEEVSEFIQVAVEAFSEAINLFHHPGSKELIATWGAWIATWKAYNGKDQKPDDWGVTIAGLRALSNTKDFLSAVAKEFEQFGVEFKNPFSLTGTHPSLARFSGVASVMSNVIRAASLPGSLIDAWEEIKIIWGGPKNGKPATILDRFQAATKLREDIADAEVDGEGLVEELAWAMEGANWVLAKIGTVSATEALNIVRTAAMKYGSKFADVTMKYLTPVFEKIVATEGGQVAVTAAQKAAGVIVGWAAKIGIGGGAEALGEAATVTLASSIGEALELALGPWGLAFVTALQLELTFAKELWFAAKDGLGHFFSTGLFGKNINEIKAEISTKSLNSNSDLDAFFRYAIYDFLKGGARDTHDNWWRTMGPKFMATQGTRPPFSSQPFYSTFPQDPYKALIGIDAPLDIKRIAAVAIQNMMFDYVNAEYIRVFQVPP